MPKMKTHKGASKRIGFTGTGKPIHVKAWRGHHLEIKSQRPIRRSSGKSVLGSTHHNQISRLLPYGG